VSRSGYTDDCDNANLYRGTVERAIRGKRGQSFLRELLAAMDAMPEKKLIKSELVTKAGEVCTIGAVCKARGLDVSRVDVEDPESVGKLVGISRSMAAEIEYMNDEWYDGDTPEERWTKMRAWVEANLVKASEVSP
jgi:hypothetical protein